MGEDNDNNNNDGVKAGNCVACGSGCKSKAMALTNYCQLHILMDKKQKLYTSCTYVNKRFVHNFEFHSFFLLIRIIFSRIRK